MEQPLVSKLTREEIIRHVLAFMVAHDLSELCMQAREAWELFELASIGCPPNDMVTIFHELKCEQVTSQSIVLYTIKQIDFMNWYKQRNANEQKANPRRTISSTRRRCQLPTSESDVKPKKRSR